MKKFLLFLGFIVGFTALNAANNPTSINDVVCNAPAQIGATTTADAANAYVYWTTTGAASYTLQYRINSDTAWKTITGIAPLARDSSAYRIANLQPCKVYVVRVKGVCSPNESSDWSRVADFRTAGCPAPCKIPEGLFAAARDSQVALNWAAGASTASYMVQFKLKTDSLWKTETVTANSLILRGLRPCVEYQFRVKITCSATESSNYSEAKTFKTLGCNVAPCTSPREIKGTAGDTKAAFTWATTGARAYEIQFKEATASDTSWKKAVVTTTTYNVDGLKNCVKYQFRVRSLCGTITATTAAMYSEWSSVTTVATTGCVPTGGRCEPVRRLTFTASATGAVLKWDSLSNVVSYDVQWRGPRDSVWRLAAGVRKNVYELSGLASCTAYAFRVKVNCTATSSSEWSAPAGFATIGCTPLCLAPKGIKVYVADSIAAISWNRTDVAKYILQYKTSTDIDWKSITVTGNVYVLNGLSRCKVYLVRLQAVCGSTSSSDYSEVAKFETRGCVPVINNCPVSKDLTATITSDSIALLYWTGASPKGFEVQYATNSDVAYVWTSVKAPAAKFSLTLKKCNSYVWRVRRICDSLTSSDWSELGKFQTTGCTVTPCAAPALPRVVASTTSSSSISLFWDNSANARDTFILQYRRTTDSVNNWKQVVVPVTPNGYSLTGLVACADYVFRVRRICAGDMFTWAEGKFKIATPNCPGIRDNGTIDGNNLNRIAISALGIFPNPGSEFAQVIYTLDVPAVINIQLMNTQGQVVNQFNGGLQDAGNYLQTLDNVSDLGKGLYFLIVRTDGKIASSQKWIKE